jgi:hypothetical protein
MVEFYLLCWQWQSSALHRAQQSGRLASYGSHACRSWVTEIQGVNHLSVCASLLAAASEAELQTESPHMVCLGACRGFTTVSTSLGHLLLALHTGLLAAVQATKQPQQQQQGQQQQQQQILVPSGALLCSLLRVLSVLVAVAPYDRLPSHLLPDVVGGTYELWQQLQQLESPPNAAAAAGGEVSDTAGAGSNSALVPEEGPAATAAAVSVLAQALSTRKASAGLAAWLEHDKTAAAAAAAAAAAETTSSSPQLHLHASADPSSRQLVPRLTFSLTNGSNLDGISAGQACSSSSSSSSSSSLVSSLLSAAVSPRPLLRIEALAALRGCCINYPTALPESTAMLSSSNSSSSSGVASWAAVLSAVSCSLAATQQVPRTPRGTPVANGSSNSSAAGANSSSKNGGSSSNSSDEVSASTSPEDKAAQHAVKLVGDWLAAAWKLHCLPNSSNSSSSNSFVVSSQDCQLQPLVQQWNEALELLLSDQLQQHPSYMIRSAAAAVTGAIPAPIWQALQATLQQQVLESTARAAQTDSVAAARAAACKVLGSLVLLPGMLAVERQQQLQQLLLAPLGKCVRDSTVSVRLSASWAVANACDALKAACGSCLADAEAEAAAPSVKCAVAAPALQLLCDAALAAAGDSEKVRANGIRAVGALLSSWQPEWGLASSSSSSNTQADTTSHQAAVAAAALSSTDAAAAGGNMGGCSPTAAELSWLPAWLRSAVGQLQSCLASRSPKVVWNAAYAAAGLLQSSCLHSRPEVSLMCCLLCYSVVTCAYCRLANNVVRGG